MISLEVVRLEDSACFHYVDLLGAIVAEKPGLTLCGLQIDGARATYGTGKEPAQSRYCKRCEAVRARRNAASSTLGVL